MYVEFKVPEAEHKELFRHPAERAMISDWRRAPGPRMFEVVNRIDGTNSTLQ
jgi:hypothetical protein